MPNLRKNNIAIVTTHGDIHASIIATKLKKRGYLCHIFETDNISQSAPLSFSIKNKYQNFFATDIFGEKIKIADLNVCWWRRISNVQNIELNKNQEDIYTAPSSTSRCAFIGGFITNFNGTFLSSPEATAIAENKLVQLKAAKEIGLPIPETLISNTIEDIIEFGNKHENIVVKSLISLNGKMIPARKIHFQQIDKDEASLAPTIFQRCINGKKHVRAIIFGDDAILVYFESLNLDWRGHAIQNMQIINGEQETKKKLVRLCKKMRLMMGIADLKYDKDGDLIFLEMNPQGQFIYVEPYINLSISDIFADFILNTLTQTTGSQAQAQATGSQATQAQATGSGLALTHLIQCKT